MEKPLLKVLAFDIAKRTGVAFLDDAGFDCDVIKFDSLLKLKLDFTTMINKWKPDLVVTPQPFGFNRTALFNHGCYHGILELVCEKLRIPFVRLTGEHSESHIKKVILGSGKHTKQEVMDRYGRDDDDIADACMFAEYARTRFSG